MKKITIIMAAVSLLLPLIGFCQDSAQGKQISSDSAWIKNEGGNFFQYRQKTYSNGEQETNLVLIGDTATTQSRFLNDVKNIAATMANDANIVRTYRLQLSELIRFANSIKAPVGLDILDSLRSERFSYLYEGSWSLGRINDPENYMGITWMENADTLAYRSDTTATDRKAEFLGPVIRLYNLNGYNEDFFITSGGYYQTASGLYILLPQGISPPAYVASRSLIKRPETQPKTELLTNGTVRIGEIVYKYNSKTKKWKELK